MNVHIGTSGFSYSAWKGVFYPEDIAASDMLRFYAERFATVEVNNTFYRMPKPEVLEGWAEQVPAAFSFALKAPQRITHAARLKDTAAESTQVFVSRAERLGGRLAPLLFQLPPYLRKDVPRLRAFLALIPASVRAAFEFRHESWVDDEVYAALRDRGAALCIAEDDGREPAIIATTGFGYLRLRRAEYDERALRNWAARIACQPWSDAYVYFKHEDEARGPRFAQQMQDIVGCETASPRADAAARKIVARRPPAAGA